VNLKELCSINAKRDAPLGTAANPCLSTQDDEHHGRDEGGPRRVCRRRRPRRPSTFSAAFSTDDSHGVFPLRMSMRTRLAGNKTMHSQVDRLHVDHKVRSTSKLSGPILVVCVDSGWGTQSSGCRLPVFCLLLFLAKKANRQHGP
jgi:hypothetical protein